MNDGKLHEYCQKAWRKTEEWNNKDGGTLWNIGSNYWMEQFSYYLNEIIREQYWVIHKDIKNINDLMDLADDKCDENK